MFVALSRGTPAQDPEDTEGRQAMTPDTTTITHDWLGWFLETSVAISQDPVIPGIIGLLVAFVIILVSGSRQARKDRDSR